MTSKLPESLTRQFRRLTADLRWSGAVRTLAWTALIAAAAFGVAWGADHAFGLSSIALRATFAVLAGVAAVGILGSVLRMVRRTPSADRLARLVEARFPELDERLLSLTTMSLHESLSPIVAGLIDETNAKCAGIDFRLAHSWRPTLRLAKIAAATILTLGLAIAIMPNAARFAGRVALAWSPTAYGFDVSISPSEGYFALGQPFALTAEIVREFGS